MTCAPEKYEEFHESRESLCPHDDGELYCNACGQLFIPKEPMSQKDDDCLCDDCAEAVEMMKEGIIT